MVDSRRIGSWFGAFAVSLVAIALIGCTQVPAPAPSAPPLSQLVVGPDGIQGLPIGVPVPVSTGLVTYGEHTCPTSGGWITGYPRGTLNSSGQVLDAFDVVTDGASKSGRITDEFVWTKQLRTVTDVRVGSPLAAVTAAYPLAKRTTSYSTVIYAVVGSRGTLVIEIAGHNADAKGEWPAAELNTVVWMHVIARGAKVSSIANNDDAGPCPVKGEDPGGTDDD
jgi:hypothetical protein